uniref:Uncharacterized protein n=1 Tax=Fagus sylvatica TaxID=28930 RepID=A0A2N9J0L3_FAGSY
MRHALVDRSPSRLHGHRSTIHGHRSAPFPPVEADRLIRLPPLLLKQIGNPSLLDWFLTGLELDASRLDPSKGGED